MSILSIKTERNALKSIAKTLRFFDELTCCQMTAEDDADTANAKNLLLGIIESGDYRAVYQRRKGTKLIKIEKP
ncbi:hypothetical protein A0256_00995 [Mucilaginibacter sp. PAMC 26640]|nr:hypothetical protein A0256_00995 [Mucilaginibacter sp. PAMC 26640]